MGHNQSELCKLAEDAAFMKAKVAMKVAAGRHCRGDNNQDDQSKNDPLRLDVQLSR
jgi:hypothetical protein